MTIPAKEFAVIHALMPILCVDLVMCSAGRVLILKRKIEPMKDEWYFPGGRVMRNERVSEAAKRISLGETALEIGLPLRFLDYTENFFRADPFAHGKGTHTVSLVFAARVPPGGVLRCDKNHLEAHFARTDELGGTMRRLAETALLEEACGSRA